MTTHYLKSWPHLFRASVEGSKRHELRRNDRDFKVGDLLVLQEYDPSVCEYTKRQKAFIVTYITNAEHPCAISDFGLNEGYCILSITPMDNY